MTYTKQVREYCEKHKGTIIDVSKEQLIGGGAASSVYALDNGDIVKVLKSGTPEDAEREILLSKWAFFKGILYLDVPAEGRQTFYGMTGNWFPWLCGVYSVFAVFSGLVMKKKPRQA